MKRLFCLLFVLCLLLCACGKTAAEVPTEPSVPATTTLPATEATTVATEPTTEATEAPTEPTTPPLGQVNPLTGEPLEEVYTGRPVSFTINNASACLPQYGLDDLDWMFEVETEGGITRCVGIMTNPMQTGAVGPVRSCRTYFLNISVSYNAPLFHCGGSVYADAFQYSASNKLSDWDHVNEKSTSKYFYRDSNRYNNLGYAWEHTLFTSGELMAQAMADKGYDQTSGEPVDYGYRFNQEVSLDGQAANNVRIEFLGGKNTTMVYDADSDLYLAHQHGKDWVDGETGENAAFRNVLVITTPQSKKTTQHGTHSFYELDGTGDGYFACSGKMIPIKWHHKGVDGPFSFTLEDGTPITLGIGSTYCAIISTDGSVTAE